MLTLSTMAYTKLLSPADILAAAVRLVELTHADGLSLRAVASALGVKAPSLYRYYPQKGALELAVAEEALRLMCRELQRAAKVSDPEARLRKTAQAYLRFARNKYPLYSFVLHNHLRETYGSQAGKDVWNLFLKAASDITGRPDDTAAAVALWSFLHGYATLEHAGGFGSSGPKGAVALGLESFLSRFRK